VLATPIHKNGGLLFLGGLSLKVSFSISRSEKVRSKDLRRQATSQMPTRFLKMRDELRSYRYSKLALITGRSH
jgi:hypothetical protein